MSPFFIHPDLELNVQLIRILAILEKASLNRNSTLVLNIEKIGAFDFFLRHPLILFEVLKKANKSIPFALEEHERNSINSIYPSREGLYRFEEHRKLIQILLIYGYLTVTITDAKEPYYGITEQGRSFIEQIDTSYALRQRELASSFVSLHSQTHKNLLAQITPHINGK